MFKSEFPLSHYLSGQRMSHLQFGQDRLASQTVVSTSAAQTETLSNTGTATLTITSVTASVDSIE